MYRILTLVFLSLSLYSYAAEDDKTFLDADFNPVKDLNSAKYYRTVESEDPLFSANVYFLNDRIQMQGSYLDSELTILHGECTYYYPNGQMESTGRFDQGKKIGAWKRLTLEGEKKPDHYYASKEELKSYETPNDCFPAFEGSEESWNDFIKTHLKFPTAAKEIGYAYVEVNVNLQVGATGEVTHFEILACPHNSFYIETIKLMAEMPAWIPALENGKNVSSNYIVKILFNEETTTEDLNIILVAN